MEQASQLNSVSDSQVKYAGFGVRFLAYWVDFLLVFLIGMLIQTALGRNPALVFQNIKSLEEFQQIQNSTSMTLVSFVSLLFGLAYFLLFYVNYDGATPGKRLLGIKVTRDDGSKVTYPVAFVRYLGIFVSACSLGLGYLWVAWDKKKQAWHDKIAKTVVVKTGAKPKTILAIIITIFTILFFSVYMGSFMYMGFKLGMQEAGNKEVDSRPAQSLKQNQENMSPEAKTHYENSQALFKQMQAVSNDVSALKPLADKTIEEAKLAVDAQPTNPILWSNLGDAYGWPNTVGTEEDGLPAYKKAEALDPNNVIYINFVGDELIKLGRNGEAVLQFQKTLRLTDSSGYAYVSIGTAYKNLGVYDEARKHLQKGIEIFQSQNKDGKYDTQILQAQKELSGLPK
ncbi:MAG: RDD family protein [Patescibacteria group bacterium]